MKIKSNSMASLLSKQRFPAAILLYGSDHGLLVECAEQIYRSVMGGTVDDEMEIFDVTRFHASDIEAERLLTACETVPMFSKRRFVMVKESQQLTVAGKNSVMQLLKEPRWMKNAVLLLLADTLDARDTMRRAFENHPEAWIVPFYPMEGAEWRQWLEQRIRQAGFTIDRQALDDLAVRLEGESQSALQEVAKLALYMGEKQHITMADVLAIVGETLEVNASAFVLAVMSGQMAGAMRLLERLLDAGQDPLMLLGMLSKRLRQMARMNALLQQGKSPAEATATLQIFWKEQTAFISHTRQWQDAAIAPALQSCLRVDRALKGAIEFARPVQEIMGHLVIALAGRGKGRG